MNHNFDNWITFSDRSINRAYDNVLSKILTPEAIEEFEDRVRIELHRMYYERQIKEGTECLLDCKEKIERIMGQIALLKAFGESPEGKIIDDAYKGNPDRLSDLLIMISHDNKWGIDIKPKYKYDNNGKRVFDLENMSDITVFHDKADVFWEEYYGIEKLDTQGKIASWEADAENELGSIFLVTKRINEFKADLAELNNGNRG